MRTIEDIYIDRITAKELDILADPETIFALNIDAREDFSVDEQGVVWGNNVDITEFEDTQLTIRTAQTINFMGSKRTPKF